MRNALGAEKSVDSLAENRALLEVNSVGKLSTCLQSQGAWHQGIWSWTKSVGISSRFSTGELCDFGYLTRYLWCFPLWKKKMKWSNHMGTHIPHRVWRRQRRVEWCYRAGKEMQIRVFCHYIDLHWSFPGPNASGEKSKPSAGFRSPLDCGASHQISRGLTMRIHCFILHVYIHDKLWFIN